jgi:hypothetical protein
MPDYGIRGPGEGTGLLPWSWAEQRLTESRNYWITSLWPDGRPHSMPVWAVASLVTEPGATAQIAAAMNAKYGGITAEFLAANALIRVEPRRAFGIAHDDFTGSPTRWEFDGR